MKLISMIDFVLEQRQTQIRPTEVARLCVKYAQFLKQPLTLGMFVPCDKKNKVLKYPDINKYKNDNLFNSDMYEYLKAKNRVLFKGFEVKTSNITNNLQNYFLIISETNEIIAHENKGQWFFNPYKEVENLIIYEITLTESAIKQIEL